MVQQRKGRRCGQQQHEPRGVERQDERWNDHQVRDHDGNASNVVHRRRRHGHQQRQHNHEYERGAKHDVIQRFKDVHF